MAEQELEAIFELGEEQEFDCEFRIDATTFDYSALDNKPQINGETLIGNKTSEELHLASSQDVDLLQLQVNANALAISTEVTDRQNADININNRIDGIVESFDGDIERLEQSIQNEATTRAENDTLLQNNINTLDEKVDGINANLTQQIDDLETKVDNQYQELTNDIDGVASALDFEIQAREQADTTINQRITDVADELNQTIEENVVALQQEDTALQNQINAHSTTLTAYDTRITNNSNAISQEIADRQAGDNTLQEQVNDNASLIETKQDIIDDLSTIRSNAQAGYNIIPQVESNTQRIEDLTTARIPDVIYHGTPKITGGQISNFSTVNYLQFPFEDISRSLPFDIYFSFTTDDDVTTQQNIIDSHFGIALAIQNSKGVMALSSNGSSWDIGSAIGTNILLPNTTYYVKYSWTGTEYNASLSTNDTEYIPDMNLTSNKSPYKTTIYIGGSEGLFGPNTAHPFKGIINFSKSRVDVNGITVWEGMADVGLASRANVSLTNLDELGQAKFDAKQDKLTQANAGNNISITYVATGKNLLNVNSDNITKGYWNAVNLTVGELLPVRTSSSNYYTSEPIEVKEGENLYMTGCGGNTVSFIYLDANMKFVSGFLNNGATERLLIVPTGAKYIRVPFAVSLQNIAQLEIGTTPTGYEPYIGKETLKLNAELDDYVKNTDYATTDTAGVIKLYNGYSTAIDSKNGVLYCQTKSATAYNGLGTSTFISKGTLENIKEGLVTSVGDTKYQDKLTVGNGIDITNNKISTNTQFVITEDMFELEYDDTKGVDPYNTSYGYTNITIHDNAGVEWVEGAIYSFVLDTKVATSTYRNVRIRIGESGDWKPVMLTSSVIAGNSVFVKSVNCIFFYKTTYQANGALHCFYDTDTNTTYTINYSIDAGQKTAGVDTYAVDRYTLIMQKPDMTWEKITNTSKKYSTATTKSVNTRGFLLNQIRYYNYTTAYANGALMSASYVYDKSASVNGSYSFNCGTAPNWEIGDYIYLVGTVKDDGLFYLDETKWWDNQLPTTKDGKLYIQLGIALTATDSTFSLYSDRPIYYHDGTGIREYIPHDNTKQDVISDLDTIRDGASKGATALQSVPSNYVTDTQLATKQDKLVAGSGIGIDNQEISVKVFDKSKFTVVGNPVIGDDGIVSDFSNGYINIGNKIDYNLFINHDWEINVPFVHQEGGGNTYLLSMFHTYPRNSVRIYNNQVWCSLVSSDYTQKTLSTILNAGSKYYIKLEHNSTTKKYKLSLFDSNYALLSSDDTFLTGDLEINQYDSTKFYIGSNTGGGERLKGSVDLAHFSITVDGVEVFNGTKTIYNALDDFVKTSNLSEINPMIISVVDGSSGCNIWANGYSEQWGNTNFSSSGTTVNLIKQMLNTNYMIVYEYVGGSSSAYGEGISVHGKTTSSFTAHGYHSTGLSNVNINWKISGYLAEGEY